MEPLLLFSIEAKNDVLPICLFEVNFYQAKFFRLDGRQGEWNHSSRLDVLPGRQASFYGTTRPVLLSGRLNGREDGKILPDELVPFEKYFYCTRPAQIH